jgi:hypothetical protein
VKQCILLICCVWASFFGHAQFSDTFSDGDFTSGPSWAGSTAAFVVNASNELQLNTSGSGQSYLYTSFPAAGLSNREWRLRVSQTFAGSDANQSRIYFAYTGTDLVYTGTGSAGVTGYFLRLGEGGSADVIRLFRDNGTTATLLASGITNISASFNVHIRVARDDAGNWSVSSDPLGGESFSDEFVVNDATYTSCNGFGIVCSYTSSNADNFFFDDLYFGNPIVDDVAPTVVSVTATSANTVQVVFSESLALPTAESESNYIVTGIGTPQSALRDPENASLVNLTFGTNFPQNVQQQIIVQGVTDNAANIMSTFNGTFLWSVPATASFRDVVFNELLADPDPPVGLPNVEFLELYNSTDESFDLNGWVLVNSTTPKILSPYLLPPGGYVILCDAADMGQFPGIGVVGIPSFSALSNAEDSLTLLNATGDLIDVVSYKDDWYASTEKRNGGWALELGNPLLPCQSSANWRESESPTGGTPGAQNSVYNNQPDTQAPQVLAVNVVDNTTVNIVFNETMDTASFEISDIAVLPFNSIISGSWDSESTALTLILQSPLQTEVYYTFTISGLNDCSGNTLLTVNREFVQGVLPLPGDVLINEILCDPSPSIGLPAAEYIELYNRTDRILELTSLLVNNGEFLEQTLLLPDSFLIVTDEDNLAEFIAYPNVAYMTGFPGLTDAGTRIALQTSEDVVIDEVNYAFSWYRDNDKDDGGYSLELINPGDPCSDASNWRASVDPRGGTPGVVNSVLDNTPDTTPPILLFAFPEPQESVTLVFDEPLSAALTEDLVFTVNGEQQNDISPVFSFDEVILYYGQMEIGVVYEFTLSGIQDCWGNEANIIRGRFALPEDFSAGDVIINEVLANAPDGGRDFVEIYNTSLRNISLKGWTIADGVSGIANTPDTIANRNLLLFPGDYLVLTRSDGSLPALYPQTRTERVWDVPGLADFSSSAEVIFLFAPNIELIDQLSFDEDMQFPLLEETDGVSLERISFGRPTNDRTNWMSASEDAGFATPGFENSQAFDPALTTDEFQVTPEIFSPDNDGFQDVVNFSYVLDSPGYVGNIHVYDSEGREQRYLMRNELLGREGTISWDGFTDERQKCPIGIYIVFFEVFDTSGSTRLAKQTCVLAHPLD